MKKNTYIYLIIYIFFLSSCLKESPIESYNWSSETIENTVRIPEQIKSIINGKYKVLSGAEYLGDYVIVRFMDNKLSIFSGKNFNHCFLKGGIKDSSLKFSGYLKSGKSNLPYYNIDLSVNETTVSELLKDNAMPDIFIIKGTLYYKNQQIPVELEFQSYFENDGFIVFAHRGGGGDNTCFSAPENSLEIIELADLFGANGVEIDIRITKDKIPIIFHDDKFSARSYNTEFCVGNIEDFYLSHIVSFCKLKNGERVSTLEDMLIHILNNTTLEYVWIDTKTAEAVDYVIPVQMKYNQLAIEQGRKLIIMIGIPTDEVYNAYMNNINRKKSPNICELETEKAINAESVFWAPKWTMGIQTNKINEMAAMGIRTVIWTVNDPEVMKVIFNEFTPDGILTDFPPILKYLYYENNY